MGQDEAVQAPSKGPIGRRDVGGVVVGGEVAVEDDDPPAALMERGEQLAIPLFRQLVGQPKHRPDAAAYGARASAGPPLANMLDTGREARGRELMVARRRVDAHVDVAHRQLALTLECAAHGCLAGTVAADESDGEPASVHRLRDPAAASSTDSKSAADWCHEKWRST